MFRTHPNRTDRPVKPGCKADRESGFVIIWATITVLFIAGIIMASTDDMRAVDQLTKAQFSAKGQAIEVAQAGLVDAFAWMRRQTVQPVDTFAPRLDLAAVTTINETDDPARGLVRTFEISPGLWGRYEVLKGIPSESFNDTNQNGYFDLGESFTDTDADGRWTPGRYTRDVSVERGMPGSGAVWLLESKGTIFTRPRADLPLGVGPNQRVASVRVATEVRRLTIKPPAEAAICAKQGSSIDLGKRARVRAKDGTAVAWSQSSGTPDFSGAEILASTTSVPGWQSGVEAVFGVNWTELKSMADISTSDASVGVPAKLADFSLVVVTGDVVFDANRPLKGTGVLVVQGNCTIEAGSNSFFNGLIYVSGNLTARAPAYLRGTIICEGSVNITGTGGDYCEVEHDASMVSRLLTTMGQYRYSKAPFLPAPLLSDGRPSELHLAKRRLGSGYAAALSTGGGGSPSPTVDPTPDPDATPDPDPTADPDPTPAPEPTPEPTPTGFSTDGLSDAIELFLLQNPGADGTGMMLEALDKLDLAKFRMAQTPPNTKGAVGAIRQAMVRLTDALSEGADVSILSEQLHGGPDTLFPQIRDMVNTMIGESGAPADNITLANSRYAVGVSKMDRAKDRMAAGNLSGAMTDFKSAASKFRGAIDEIDDFQ